MGYFRAGFAGVIALIVLVILGIILIYRNVKNACLNLGIIFTFCGASALVTVLISRSIANYEIGNANIPNSFRDIPKTLLKDGLSPLQTVSLVYLIGGLLLIAAAIIYPRMQQKKAE